MGGDESDPRNKTLSMEAIVHRSKIGFGILTLIVVVLGTVLTLITIESVVLGLIIGVPIIWFTIHIYHETIYSITNGNSLVIKFGILETTEIPIEDIEWIRKSNDVSSAPALSTDRLEIGYKGGRVLISPRDKKQFVSDLKKINPNIWWTS